MLLEQPRTAHADHMEVGLCHWNSQEQHAEVIWKWVGKEQHGRK